MPPIAVGQPAPAFALNDQTGAVRTLAEFRGKPVILYFYPEDGSPSCTNQACAFRDAGKLVGALDAVVLGISPDDAASHERFARKQSLTFTLLADPPAADGVPPTAAAFGVWQEKSMYGKTYMGIVRTTFLIDAKGVVAARWDKVRVNGHVDEVLASARALASGTPIAAPPAAAGAPKAASKATKPVAKPAAKKAAGKPATRPATPRAKAGASTAGPASATRQSGSSRVKANARPSARRRRARA